MSNQEAALAGSVLVALFMKIVMKKIVKGRTSRLSVSRRVVILRRKFLLQGKRPRPKHQKSVQLLNHNFIDPDQCQFLLTEMLKAAQLKGREFPPARQSSPALLVIHIPELHEYIPDHNPWHFTDEKPDPSYRQDILKALKLAIHDYQALEEPRNVILIASSHRPSGAKDRNNEHRRLATIGIDPYSTVVSVIPVNSEVQRALLSNSKYEEERNESLNLCAFKRRLRESSPLHRDHSLLEPYTSWEFLKKHSEFAKMRQGDLDFSRYEGKFSGQVDEATLTKELRSALCKLQVADRRWQLLNEWDQQDTATQESTKQVDKWENLPKKVRKAMEDIKRNSNTMKFESQFLSMVINPCKSAQLRKC
jgi:hypothetical protein